MPHSPSDGKIVWQDLTVPNADNVRDFYAAVVGWKPDAVDMGGYSDYSMIPPGGGDAIAGVCHARGVNAEMPPVWMLYVQVPSVTASIAACEKNGGRVVGNVRSMGSNRFCVIADPAGAQIGIIGPD